MKVNDFNDYVHIDICHDIEVEWITAIREEFISHRRTLFGERILNYLRDWLRDHIPGEDQLYRPFIGKQHIAVSYVD